jgi:hypothetical protein
MNSEMKDYYTRKLLDQQTELYRDFREALDQLMAISDDFTDGSQQRFMNAMRECTALRDELWKLQQQLDAEAR